MNNFYYWSRTKIHFGKNTEQNVGKLMKELGKKVLLVYGGGSIKKTGLYDTVTKALESEGLEWVELSGVQPNPRLSKAHEGIDLCRKERVDCILAVGGGSVIDTAKAVGVGALYDGEIWDLFGHDVMQDYPMLPLGVILTIPAAGSETSHALNLVKEPEMLKWVYASLNIRPDFAILNPELTYSLPPYQTACGITDILSHVMERYLGMTKPAEITDKLCEALMRGIINVAPKVFDNPNDYDARAEIMWAGTIAHNDFFGVGRDQDWAAHNIEHELSAEYDLTHGAGLAIIFPAWCRFIAQERKERFVQFAVRVWDVDLYLGNKDDIIEEGIRRMEAFFRRMGLQTRLSEIGIDSKDFDKMAKRGAPTGFSRRHDYDDFISVYNLAL